MNINVGIQNMFKYLKINKNILFRRSRILYICTKYKLDYYKELSTNNSSDTPVSFVIVIVPC